MGVNLDLNRRFGIIAAAVCSVLALGGGVITTQVGSAQSAASGSAAGSFTISAPVSVRPGEFFTITVSGVPVGRWAAIESQGGTLGWPQANGQGYRHVANADMAQPHRLDGPNRRAGYCEILHDRRWEHHHDHDVANHHNDAANHTTPPPRRSRENRRCRWRCTAPPAPTLRITTGCLFQSFRRG